MSLLADANTLKALAGSIGLLYIVKQLILTVLFPTFRQTVSIIVIAKVDLVVSRPFLSVWALRMGM